MSGQQSVGHKPLNMQERGGGVGKMQLFVMYKVVYSDIAHPLFFLTAFAELLATP